MATIRQYNPGRHSAAGRRENRVRPARDLVICLWKCIWSRRAIVRACVCVRVRPRTRENRIPPSGRPRARDRETRRGRPRSPVPRGH